MRLFVRSASRCPSKLDQQEFRMRQEWIRGCASTFWFAVVISIFCMPMALYAQGGEPPYFAIRGAKIVPVSGPPVEGATIVISRGIITAIGKDAAIPPEAWIIDGKGLTVY